MELAIAELTKPCLTRRRGGMAAEALLSRDDGSAIHLLLGEAELLSLSFLDELVQQLEEACVLERLTFETTRSEHIEKLGRIRDIREVEIYTVVGDKRVLVDVKEAPELTEAAATDRPPREPQPSH